MTPPRLPALRRRLADRLYYGWVVAAACLLTSLAVFGTTYSFGVFADRMLRTFDTSPARIALAFSLQTVVLYLAATPMGRFVDRYGPRRTLPLGGALLAAGLAWAARSGSLAELALSYGVLGGLGLSLLYVVAYATVPRWFGRRRGAANGIATAGLGVGLVAVPPAASALVVTVGWRGALTVLAGGVLVLVAVVTLLFADDPASVGADPSVEFPGRRSAGEGSVGTDGGDEDETDPAAARRRIVRTLRSPAFLLVLAGWICVYATLYAILGHVVIHVTAMGLPKSVGVTAIAVIGATTTVARLGLGALSDRVGRVRMFVACSLAMGATTAALTVAATPLALYAVVAVYGVGYGGNGALLSPLVADLFGGEDLSTLYGAMSLAFGAAGLAAPPLTGLVYECVGSYDPAFAALGAVGILGAGCIALAGRRTGDL